ncbi:DUF4132 domain-containing protein [Massilia violaceinigra]|uniref:DUF4132 domain-containing protein n=1 Tax=Massilia violaceinigra TaxID=2045208 RepID=A0ABY4A741_9BURK|nr:DUF4132 domain-containing protein [Massilia violaceinigra]UOD30604.1 DUF4132 domain-containing protein [Massilia violaceinigra]
MSAAVAPWLAAGPVLDVPAELAAMALPSRRVPGAPCECADAAVNWQVFRMATAKGRLDPARSDAVYRPAIDEAVARLANDTMDGSLASDAILFALEGANTSFLDENGTTPFVDFLVAHRGLAYAVQVLLVMERPTMNELTPDYSFVYAFTAATRQPDYWHGSLYSQTELALRNHLALASPALWDQCQELMRRAAPSLPAWRRPLLAALMPDAPELANELALLLQTPDGTSREPWHEQTIWLYAYATSAAARKALHQWPRAQRTGAVHLYSKPVMAATLLQDRGAEAVAVLREGAADSVGSQVLACIGTPQAMSALALAHTPDDEEFAFFHATTQRWPLASIAALSEVIANDRGVPPRARRALSHLVAAQGAGVAALQPWIPPAAWTVLATVAARYIGTRDVAADADLPEALSKPRWATPPRKAAPDLVLDALPLAPVAQWSAQQREQLGGRHHYASIDWVRASGAELKILGAAIASGDSGKIIAACITCLKTDANWWDASRMIGDLRPPLNAQVWNAVAAHEMHDPGYVIAKLGLDGLPGLLLLLDRRPAENLSYAQYFGATALAPAMARVYATLKGKAVLAAARQWLLSYPEHAACGLVPAALGKRGEPREHARRALRMLAASGHAGLLMEVAARYQENAVTHAMRALIDEDPLDLYPANIGKLPAFWTPLEWTRPLLAGNGKALPDGALDTIGVMLGFPCGDGVYPGLAQVRAACSADSLAGFAWDLFCAWLEDGAPARQNWAYLALGLLGNDDSARKLTPLIRAWPGQSQHARAAMGLDILAMIGSDVALMLLNGVAQKLKFKGLQDRAREKIAAIAEERGLSPEELGDYLAPDLGLDQEGGMLLDFGPRQFRVGFDETLKPFVRDNAGALLADLPKPRKTDDATLSADAVARFKLLKKDARTVAAQQVLRLERAMCAQRRWPQGLFFDVLAHHPLVRHLVQRLVWGVYGDGDALLACFRVAPDGSLTDAGDNPFVLPQGENMRFGIVHAMELAPVDAAGFGQLFADYQLLQPFAQLGRDTYALEEDERGSEGLWRWGSTVPAGRVLDLVNRGWRRSPPENGGVVRELSKQVGGSHLALLRISPGLVAGNGDEHPQQGLDYVLIGRTNEWGGMGDRVKLSSLSPVVISELIRDMEQLCA